MSNVPPYSYRWTPIEDLPENWEAMASTELRTLANIWNEHADGLGSPRSLQRFNERLARHWAIETGIIEGIYKIDRGTTELLIERGIETALIPHGSTDKPAEEIVAILQDHQGVLEGLFDFVASRRPLSTSYIKEIHAALCAHQNEVDAKDSLGHYIRVPLRKGEWKLQSNNPQRPDDLIHEYCPPEHVASEMDRLIAMHCEHTQQGLPPEVEAAWLHHRFSQIHPFQDGNGRVARALATLVLLRAKLFPFTVDRTERQDYITQLETADAGDLKPLVDMLAKSQRRALVKALSLSDDLVGEDRDIDSLIEAGVNNLRERKAASRRNLEEVYGLAENLQRQAYTQLSSVAQRLHRSLKEIDQRYGCQVFEVQPGQEHWFHYQTVQVARRLEYYADIRRYHRWVKLCITEEHPSNLIVSFHPLGVAFRGVMAVTAFYEERPMHGETEPAPAPDPTPLVSEVFEFVYTENLGNLMPRFEAWLAEVLRVALTEWRQSM